MIYREKVSQTTLHNTSCFIGESGNLLNTGSHPYVVLRGAENRSKVMGLKKPTRRQTARQGTDVAQGQATLGAPLGPSPRSRTAPRAESRRAFNHACRETIESLELRLL